MELKFVKTPLSRSRVDPEIFEDNDLTISDLARNKKLSLPPCRLT